MTETWDKVARALSNHFKGDGYKNSLLKNIDLLRVDMTERSEYRFVFSVATELERSLVQKSILSDLTFEFQKYFSAPFNFEFEVTGLQQTFPAPIIDIEPINQGLTTLPSSIEPLKRTITASDYTLSNTIFCNETEPIQRLINMARDGQDEIPNPILLTGESGTGKSHFAKVIANELQHRFESHRIKNISGERFLTEFLESLKQKQGWKFQRKYRDDVDALLIDDISCLKTAKKTQEELLATIDYFISRKKLLLFVLPKSPFDIEGLDPSLCARLSSGIHFHLPKPSVEKLTEFSLQMLKSKNLVLEELLVTRISQSTTSYRELTGKINKLAFMFTGRTDVITLQEAARFIDITVQDHKPTPDEILRIVSARFKIDVKTIISKSRKREVLISRNYAIQMMRDQLGLTLSEIGTHVGYRDHTTVRNALQKRVID